MEKEIKDNPKNSAGECLFYEEENIKDTSVEDNVLNSGFNNGINAKSGE